MESVFSFVAGLLTAALSLLGFVQQHPELPQTSKDQAQQIAQQAIQQATHTLTSANQNATTATKPASIVVDVDGDIFMSVVYENLPMSKIVLVSASSSEQFDVDDNVQGSGVAELEGRNNTPGNYYLKVTAHDTGLEAVRSNTFYIGSR